ncbi:MAG TPA: Rieske 2Fe-2S domain-containing protein [Chloroflexota bacterium]|nr:Rieske 2Fe-2S domain-containing protein [Chloroflexota bacterium]
MLTQEENDRLTRVGPGTPGGEFMRRYWQPAALSEELPPGGAPVPVRLLGEDLVLFRDETGHPGLLGIHCSHRGADLSYGRLEDGGLRCIYHGWLFDRSGRCLEQPGEPTGSTFHERIRHTAYPCHEQAGIIFTYMGPGEPPLFPAYEFLLAPPDHTYATKYYEECNYLQGNEGNFDPQHLSFLHRFFKPRDDADFRNAIHAADPAPQIEPVDTGFGMHLYAIRKAEGNRRFVKVRSFIMPSAGCVGSRGEAGYNVNWHVPIDDEHHWRYGIWFDRTGPVDPSERSRARASVAENYRLKRNKANRYLQDREEMKTSTFLGMGKDFVVHDSFVTESEGPIYDRTIEHLGYTDRGLIHMRKIMLDAIRDVENGREPRGVVRDVALNQWPDLIARDDILPAEVDWKDHWKGRSTQPVGSGAR